MPIVDALCPHRGGKTKMTTGAGASKVLAAGELFVEYPDTGVGKGKSKIKIGDGVTAYSSLPYALGETSTDLITFSESTATSVAQALNEAVSGASLATIIGGLKKAIQLASQSGGVNIFTGTLEEWNQLTDAEKAEYDLISNDEPGGLQDMFPSSLVGYGANSNVEAELNKLNDDSDKLHNIIILNKSALLDETSQSTEITVTAFTLYKIEGLPLGRLRVEFSTTADSSTSGLFLGEYKYDFVPVPRLIKPLVDDTVSTGDKASLYFNRKSGHGLIRAYNIKATHGYILDSIILVKE